MFEKPTRKIVAGLEEESPAIISDEKIHAFSPYFMCPSFQVKELFYTEDIPQSLKTRHFDKSYNIDLPKGAFRCAIFRMPTKQEIINDLLKANQELPDDWKKFNLHSTDTIDYIYVISGKITCLVGGKEIHLEAGDFLTQIGAEHTWLNDHDEPCQFFCVIVGTEANPNRGPVPFK